MGGMTPIAWSIYTSDIEMISLFIKAGINLNQQDSNGQTPLTIAIIRQNDRGQEPFLTYQFLIENGADTNLENGKGQTPLSLAVMNNRYDIVTYLVSKGVDINKTSGLVEGLTPLFISIRNNNFEISKFLIENGADVNKSESRHGNYPVNYAIHNADFDMIELLLNSGANLNVKKNAQSNKERTRSFAKRPHGHKLLGVANKKDTTSSCPRTSGMPTLPNANSFSPIKDITTNELSFFM